jgi:hypothetical protein
MTKRSALDAAAETVAVIKWMAGFNLAATMAILFVLIKH